jgi:hypothetical protein
MLYRLLADLVIVIHCIVVWFLFFGAFLSRQHPWLVCVHVPLVFRVSAAFIKGWTCPLTPLENQLRKAAGEQGYKGGFLDHYFRIGSPPQDSQSTRKGHRTKMTIGLICFLVAILPHFANLEEYRDYVNKHFATHRSNLIQFSRAVSE